MFIKACSFCRIQLEVKSTNGENIAIIMFYSTTHWKEVQFDIKDIRIPYVDLVLSTLTKDDSIYPFKNESNQYWSFSSLKYCHPNGFRMIESDQNASCQLISKTTRIVTPTQKIKNSAENDNCNANTVGSSCIPCFWIINNKTCGNLKICDEQKCSCSAGYQVSSLLERKCIQKCGKGIYGPNCQKKCGKCAVLGCNEIDGKCLTRSCSENYYGPKCDIPPLPQFKYPPKVGTVSYHTAEILVENFETIHPNHIPETFMLEYKLADSTWNWTTAIENLRFNRKAIIKIEGLEPGKKYLVRCVVSTPTPKSDLPFEDKLPTTSFTTKCDEITEADVTIIASNTSARIKIPEKQTLCKYKKIEMDLHGKTVEVNNRNTVQNLKPFENYKITIFTSFSSFVEKIFKTTEGIPSKVKNLNLQLISSNKVHLEWKQPESPNGAIQNYIVNYELISRKGCKSRSSSESPGTQKITRQLSETIGGLTPYSMYSFSVFATNKAFQGEVTTVTQDLDASDVINEDEVPRIESIEPNKRSVDIKFSRISCDKMNGPLRIKFSANCSTDGCSNQKTDQLNISDDKDTTFKQFPGLLPFTAYTLQMKFCRNDRSCSNYGEKRNFKTAPETPYLVRDLLVYSKNEHSISLRWKPPHPPTGTLDLYKIECSSSSTDDKKRISKIQSTHNCELWPKYQCYTIDNLSKNKDYNVKVLAKNKETDFGQTAHMNAETIIEQPGPPTSISLSWTLYNEQEISWKHPIIANGDILFFNISVVPHQQEIGSVFHNLDVTKPLRKYTIIANDTLPSTRYRVTVRAFNGYLGEPIITEDVSPPSIPTFTSKPEWLATNTTISLTIPPQNIENNNYTLFLLINDGNTNNHADLQTLKKKFKTDLSMFTILYHCQLQDKKELQLTIGRSISENNIDCTANSRKFLSPETPYNFTFLLKNTDSNNNSSYSLLSYIIKTSGKTAKNTNQKLLALLALLLIIPLVVLIFVFRKRCSVNSKHNSIKRYIHCNSAIEEQQYSNEEYELPLVRESSGTKSENFVNSYQIERFHSYVKESIQKGKLITQCEAVNIAEYDVPSVPLSYDFVNMHYKTEKISKAYIISIVPNKQHLNDFWRLIHNNKVEDIVLLDNTERQVQSEAYWPDLNTTYQCDDISVFCFMEKVFSKFERKMFRIYHNDSVQTVNQLRFWSPLKMKKPLDFVPFFQEMLKIPLKDNSPVLVHCSSPDITEIGFILLCDMTLRTVLKDQHIDVLAHLKNLYNSCVSITNGSYELANLVVLETLLFRELNNNITDNDSANEVYFTEEKFTECVKYLKETIWLDNMVNENHNDYMTTIRSKEVNSLIDEFNAVLIDGYKVPAKFLLIQNPMPDEFDKLWTMIIQMQISVIVSLNTITPKTNVFWPMGQKQQVLLSTQSKLRLDNTKRLSGYDWFTLHLTNLDSDVDKVINIFSVKNWPPTDVCPSKMSKFVQFCAETNKKTKNLKRVLVTSHDGFTPSSIYVAMDYIINQVNAENKCDICTSIRTVRHQLQLGGNSEEKFRFVWKASKYYLRKKQSFL